MNHQRVIIDISLRSLLKIIGVLLGIWFLYSIRDIVLLFFLVIIIVMALAPIVNRWQKHMSRPLAVGLLVTLILAGMVLIVSLLIPPLVMQVTELTSNLPMYSDQIQNSLSSFSQSGSAEANTAQQLFNQISQQLSRFSGSLINATLGFLGGFVAFITAIVLTIYLLIEEKGIRHFLFSLLPINHKEQVVNAFNKVGEKLGSWLRSQLLLMLIMGTSTAVWTAVLGLPYWLTLGLWAGLTEVIPFVGPILGGIPIILIALLDSPIKALVAFVLIALTQQIESNFIVPKVMQRSVGLSPVIVILALLIGGKLFGITGTILAVPLAATLSVVVHEWPKISKILIKEK